MNLQLAQFSSRSTTSAVVAVLCLVPFTSQAANPWNPYPVQQAPAMPPAAAPKPQPKYYQEPPATPQSTQNAPAGPSRFAPADLERQLSTVPHRQPNTAPYGYQGPPANFGPPPFGYGGYGPPINNNIRGGFPGNSFSPFGF